MLCEPQLKDHSNAKLEVFRARISQLEKDLQDSESSNLKMEQQIAKLQAEIAKLTCKSQDLLDNAVQLEKSKSELSRLKSFEKAHKWEEELLITKRLRAMAETSKNHLSNEHDSLLVGLDNERQQNKMDMEKLKTENLRLQEIINAQKLCIETVDEQLKPKVDYDSEISNFKKVCDENIKLHEARQDEKYKTMVSLMEAQINEEKKIKDKLVKDMEFYENLWKKECAHRFRADTRAIEAESALSKTSEALAASHLELSKLQSDYRQLKVDYEQKLVHWETANILKGMDSRINEIVAPSKELDNSICICKGTSIYRENVTNMNTAYFNPSSRDYIIERADTEVFEEDFDVLSRPDLVSDDFLTI